MGSFSVQELRFSVPRGEPGTGRWWFPPGRGPFALEAIFPPAAPGEPGGDSPRLHRELDLLLIRRGCAVFRAAPGMPGRFPPGFFAGAWRAATDPRPVSRLRLGLTFFGAAAAEAAAEWEAIRRNREPRGVVVAFPAGPVPWEAFRGTPLRVVAPERTGGMDLEAVAEALEKAGATATLVPAPPAAGTGGGPGRLRIARTVEEVAAAILATKEPHWERQPLPPPAGPSAPPAC